jgi:hypothetical protein
LADSDCEDSMKIGCRGRAREARHWATLSENQY